MNGSQLSAGTVQTAIDAVVERLPDSICYLAGSLLAHGLVRPASAHAEYVPVAECQTLLESERAELEMQNTALSIV